MNQLSGTDPDGALIVVYAPLGDVPEVIHSPQIPRPDRHLVLGLVQSAVFAVEESDPEIVLDIGDEPVFLEHEFGSRELGRGMIITRAASAEFHVFLCGIEGSPRKHARETLRFFTGTVRLDIP